MLLCTAMVSSCGDSRYADDPLASSGRTQRTENLLKNLIAQADSGLYMFGHQDSPVYGIGWEADVNDDASVGTRSDVKSVTGDMPAVMGFDLGHLEIGDSLNLDGVSFNRMRKEIINHFNRGGMVTLSWHARNPLSGGSAWVADSLRAEETHTVEAVLDGGSKHDEMLQRIDRIADFIKSLETPYGVRIPVLFRPWHEHTGSWFWWGKDHCTAEQYKALWKMTTERLHDRGVVNVLYAYSPGTESDGDETIYMERYPGDDMVDLLGLDCYCFAPDADTTKINGYAAQLDKNLDMICRVAKQHGKAAALTETGYECIRTADWWTKTLMPVMERHALSYVLVWRNAHNLANHYYAPFPGQPSTSDFVRFYNAKRSLFRSNVNALYLGDES